MHIYASKSNKFNLRGHEVKLHLFTMLWRSPAGTLPSSLMYITSGIRALYEVAYYIFNLLGTMGYGDKSGRVSHLSKSFSTMSSMLFSWQNTRARCWLTTGAAESLSEEEDAPIPQSLRSCLEGRSLNRIRSTTGKHRETHLRADSFGAWLMSLSCDPWALSWAIRAEYWGWALFSTKAGWLHSFFKYCRAYSRNEK